MITLYVGETSNAVVTVTENETLVNPNYLFVFTNLVTEQEVAFVKLNASDLSTAKERYNEFEIDASVLFDSVPTGFWWYKIYEQASSSNLIPDNATTLLEQGYMQLKNRTATEVFTEHNSENTYITR